MNKRMKILMTLSVALMLIILVGCQKADQYDPEGSSWKLTELNGSKPIDGTVVTLGFESGQISGVAGCNHYGGNYTIKGEQISFDSVFNTEMACQNPEGVMVQEQAYLDILQDADQISQADDTLRLTSSTGETLRFEPYDPNIVTEVSGEVDDTVQVQAPTTAPEVENSPVETPSWAYHTYWDEETGITIFIPETWIVTNIIEGDIAILQSYPEDKYVGGEPFEEGDTKCDLNIMPAGTNLEELVEGWQSDPMTTILAEEPFEFAGGHSGTRYEINSLGDLISYAVDLDGQVVVLSCFGDFTMVDEIAATLNAGN